MPSQSYRITEPHPSVPASHYLYSGRGGMGNFNHLDPKTITPGSTASGPASRANLSGGSISSGSSSKRSGSSASAAAAAALANGSYYPAGRGGAGNMHSAHASERPIFSFDEELERQQRMMQHMAPVYHIGRGGAGNFAATASAGGSGSDTSSLSRRSSSGSESSSSAGVNMVNGGVRNSLEGTWHRLRGSFAK